MGKRNNEDSDISDTLVTSDEEMMEPLDMSTNRENSAVATFDKRTSPISPNNQSYFTRFNSDPSHSQSSLTSDSLNAAVTVENSMSPLPDTTSLPALIPLARTQMDTNSSTSSARVNKNSTSFERMKSRYSQPNLLTSSPAQAENVLSVHSSAGMNLSALKASSKRSPLPKRFSSTTTTRNSFVGNQYLNSSEREPTADDKEYNNNNFCSDNKNLMNTLFQNNATSSPLPSLQAFQTNQSLMHLYQNNPLFLLNHSNFVKQNIVDAQPTTTSSLQQHIPLLAPHLSVPTTVPPLFLIGENPYSFYLNEEAKSQESCLQFRAEMLSKEQVGRNKCRSRSLQIPKEKSSNDGNRGSSKKGDSNRGPNEENDSNKSLSEERYWNRDSRKEGDSSTTPMEEPSSSSEENKKSNSDPSKETVKDKPTWERERRRKKNEYAKRLCIARRVKENAARIRMDLLLAENNALRQELDNIKTLVEAVRAMKILPKRPQPRQL